MDEGWTARRMIDNFALLVSHGLLALAFWRLTMRDDLDKEAPATPEPPRPTLDLRPAPRRGKSGGPSGKTPDA